jgi:hypothetical protein
MLILADGRLSTRSRRPRCSEPVIESHGSGRSSASAIRSRGNGFASTISCELTSSEGSPALVCNDRQHGRYVRNSSLGEHHGSQYSPCVSLLALAYAGGSGAIGRSPTSRTSDVFANELLQRNRIKQLQRAALHLDQRSFLEPREQPAHGLQLEAEITADLLARHAQHEFGG